MKKLSILLFLMLWSITSLASSDQPNGKTKNIIIHHNTDHQSPHLVDVLPIALFYDASRALTIEFPANGFEPYTLTVETMLTTQEYYVTTPFVSQYISPDVVNVNLYLETDGGDLYWGSFEATDYTSME